MILKNKGEEPQLVGRLKKVMKKVRADRLDLSPATVYELLENCDKKDIEVLELDIDESGEKTKHIAIDGIPIVLSIKLSHLQHRADLKAAS